MEGEILSFLRNNGHRTYRPNEIAKKLSITENDEYRRFRGVLDRLAGDGKIALIKGGRFAFRPKETRLTGTLKVHPDGFGFVYVEDEDREYFVRGRRMETALDGDTVEIGKAASRKGDRRLEAEIIRVVTRKRENAVGTFRRMGDFGVVLPDDRRFEARYIRLSAP